MGAKPVHVKRGQYRLLPDLVPEKPGFNCNAHLESLTYSSSSNLIVLRLNT